MAFLANSLPTASPIPSIIIPKTFNSSTSISLSCRTMEVGNSVTVLDDVDVVGDFPLVVIEYFYEDNVGCKSDHELRMEGQDHIATRLRSMYHESTGRMDDTAIELDETDNRVFHGRWEKVEVIAIIYPSQTQTYFSESLNHPHYSVHPREFNSFCKRVKAFQRMNNGFPHLRLCKGDSNHVIPGRLYVTNLLPKPVSRVMDEFPLSRIAKVVSDLGVLDEKRGNTKLDSGLACSMSQVRTREWFGLSGPSTLTTYKQGIVREVHALLHKLVMVAIPRHRAGDVYHHPKKSLFFDPDKDRHKGGIHIHSFRVSIGKRYSLLMIHQDRQNDNCDPNFSPVLVTNWIVCLEGVPVRIALITYSRKSVSDTMAKIERYGPALQYLTNFYHRMEALGRTHISKSIFDQSYVKKGYGQLTAARIAPHMDPCVHWSAMGAGCHPEDQPSLQAYLPAGDCTVVLRVCQQLSRLLPHYYQPATPRRPLWFGILREEECPLHCYRGIRDDLPVQGREVT